MVNESSPLKNRIKKNLKKIQTYLIKKNIHAFRIYNKEIPEIPYLIDIYENSAVVYEQGKKLNEDELHKRSHHQNDIKDVLFDIFQIPEHKIFIKTREKKKGPEQYQLVNSRSQDFFEIEEGPLKFIVNLEKYLDTGLFLDHRPLREFLSQNCNNQKVLNLFSYTGSLSVAAAFSGAQVTSIDLSATYLDWAKRNFQANQLDLRLHEFIKSDILTFLRNNKSSLGKFDKILLDPPSFSNSKSMLDVLDIQRDHSFLITESMKILKHDGELYFSTNKRKFELDESLKSKFLIKEITQWTVPQDFHFSQIHQCFLITNKKN